MSTRSTRATVALTGLLMAACGGQDQVAAASRGSTSMTETNPSSGIDGTADTAGTAGTAGVDGTTGAEAVSTDSGGNDETQGTTDSGADGCLSSQFGTARFGCSKFGN